MRPAPAALLALLLTAAPLAAQDDGFRRTFTFLRDDLVIDVVADGSGSLLVVRGGRGDIGVVARTRGVLLSAAAPGRPGDPLRLVALGSGRADWIVTVPAHVRIQVRTPATGHVVSATGDAPAWRWEASRRVRRTAYHRPTAPREQEDAFAFTERDAPDTVAIRDLDGIRRITVRYDGDRFGIAASSAASLERASGRLDVRPHADRPLDLLVILPAGTTHARIIAGDRILVTGAGETGCSPVTISTLADGTRILDFTPIRGRLDCRS